MNSDFSNSANLSQDLELPLQQVESRLHQLGDALRRRDSVAIELHAAELHKALASAIARFSDAAKSGSVPAVLRRRLVDAGGQVAAQRESLARATAALDRAMDVLMPRDLSTVYGAHGTADRSSTSGVIQA